MASIYHPQKNIYRADPFIDLLFNTLLGFSFLFLVSLLFINPEADQAKVDKQAEYIISATWPEQLADDIDLWVHSPSGHTVSYLQKEAGWLHLDRDDRGEINDIVMIDGEEVIHPTNQEIVTIRNRQKGEYIVNLYYYKATSAEPVPVKIKVDRINPRYETVVLETIRLAKQDQEKTVVRFTIDESGAVTDINHLPIVLTPYRLDHMPAWAN
ncbi:MAG TPA: hypothetical protein EYH06_10830 [Chromatiales bacterium]|nr:hypothetical protein [Thiotrichales bacterium]HIP69062.1 hypothetical protein [Chromatiales bacterium]